MRQFDGHRRLARLATLIALLIGGAVLIVPVGAAHAQSSAKSSAKSGKGKKKGDAPVPKSSKTTGKSSTKSSPKGGSSSGTSSKPRPAADVATPVRKATPVPTSPAVDPAPSSSGGTPYVVTRATTVSVAPEAAARGQLQKGTPVEVIGRDRGWVRVRTEGWVREADLTPSDTAIRTSVSAADLRNSPDRYRGVMLKWTMEYLALQTADTLRHGLTPGEPYLLARGPGDEDALVYLAVPASLLGMARALTPLSKISVVARVRTGRSEPAGVAVLDVESIQALK